MLVFPLSMIMASVFAQDQNAALGNEYYLKGDYEKAIAYYEKYLKTGKDPFLVYDNYYQALIGSKELSKAEKEIKKLSKKDQGEIIFKIDLLLVMQLQGKEKEFQKEKQEFLNQISVFQVLVEAAAKHLFQRNQADFSEELYLVSRKTLRSPTLYAQNLMALYKFSGNKEKLIEEGVNLLDAEPSYLSYVQNYFQDEVREEDFSKKLEEKLISSIQSDPESQAMNEMLIWYYVQKKDFYAAFIQGRSVDQRKSLGGKNLLELGEIMYKNKAYEDAVKLYSYLAKEYSDNQIFGEAKRMEISSREALIKETYPIDSVQIRELIAEYQKLIDKIGKKRSSAEAYRSMALLHAFQMAEYDRAISLLKEALLIPRTPRIFSGKCKLDMGDIYLLKDQPWESKLLYAQVEKSYKDQPIGHEGKYRLARIFYFTGEFELAKANLDILKRATTRVIANDAMQLSLLIQDNSALDTSYDALLEFSKIDLVYFSQQYQPARIRFEAFLDHYPSHSLIDETYLRLARIHNRMGEFETSIKYFDRIIDEYPEDILVDDALFHKAEILEEKLNNKEGAMEAYKKILFDYPGSFYAEEARKRFRELRGDSLN